LVTLWALVYVRIVPKGPSRIHLVAPFAPCVPLEDLKPMMVLWTATIVRLEVMLVLLDKLPALPVPWERAKAPLVVLLVMTA